MKPRNRPTVSNLEPHQYATMFPSLGFFDEKRGCWKLLVHGRVYSTETVPLGTRLLLKGLKRAMKATPEQVASDVFQQRIGGFLTKPIPAAASFFNWATISTNSNDAPEAAASSSACCDCRKITFPLRSPMKYCRVHHPENMLHNAK